MLIAIAFIVAYTLLAHIIYAGVCCHYANKDGYVLYSDRESAVLWAVFWPFMGTFGMIWRLLMKLKSFLFVLCFRHKYGVDPTYKE